MGQSDTSAQSEPQPEWPTDLHQSPDWLVRFANFIGIRGPSEGDSDGSEDQ
jgi:hypothetical protein